MKPQNVGIKMNGQQFSEPSLKLNFWKNKKKQKKNNNNKQAKQNKQPTPRTDYSICFFKISGQTIFWIKYQNSLQMLKW